MIWIKIAFVALLCLPILYFGFTFLNRLLDHAIEKRPKVDPLDDPESGFAGRRGGKDAEKTGVRRSRPLQTIREQGESDESLWVDPAQDRDRKSDKKRQGRARAEERISERDKDKQSPQSRRKGKDATGVAQRNASRRTGGREGGKTRGETTRGRRSGGAGLPKDSAGRGPGARLEEKRRRGGNRPPLQLLPEENGGREKKEGRTRPLRGETENMRPKNERDNSRKPSGRQPSGRRGVTDWDEE